MKTFAAFILFSFQAFAVTESIQAYGRSNGYCRGDGFSNFCVDQLQDRAKRDSEWDADFKCRHKQGNLLRFSAYCNTYCNPSFIPNGQDAFVSCTASCRYDCDVPRRP